MKLVGYQQPTCLCVKMEFVVGNHFAFMRIVFTFVELFSFTWASTIVYRKWFFHLHVECCGSCIVSNIGVGAGKCLGVQRSFDRIFPNLPEKFWATSSTNFSLKDHEDLFWVISKKGLHVFLCKRWAPFYEIKQGWAPFFPGISEILPRFSINQNF